MTRPWDNLKAQLQQRHADGLLRLRRTVEPLPNGRCRIDGREYANFASNDYLGLAGDPRVIEAAISATRRYGAGARASALVSGRTPAHAALETAIAEFEQQPAAVLFPSGYAANLGTITALVRPEDVLFCDRFNHASLVDACRLSKATFKVYRHDRLDELSERLEKCRDVHRGIVWIVTDSVFSMEGDLAPLPQLVPLARRFEARIILDEAHGTGVFGAAGRGVAEHHAVEDEIDVRIGTLSKAIGSQGGFVAGPVVLIDYLWNMARPQIYSTALTPAACAAAEASLQVITQEPERRMALQRLSQRLREHLQGAGLTIPAGSTGPIVPVVLGQAEAALAAGRRLEDEGFLVGVIRPPTVPRGTARLRITLSATHSPQAIDDLAAAVIRFARGLI